MHWLLLDTESSGTSPPIFALELAAQRMSDWEPEGPPFRRLLNHNRDILPETSRMNGLTREILECDGDPPRQVYSDFADYAGDLPLVAYNLPFNLEQVLRPEWERLGLKPACRAGFCALRLAQRLLDPLPAGNHKLETLRQYYRLPEPGAHTALGKVKTVIDLLQLVLRPLAEQHGLLTLDQIQTFVAETWYPKRIAFGKFKGRHFADATNDAELHGWLQWLASSNNLRSAEMGRWYLQQLEHVGDTDLAAMLVEPAGTELVIYIYPELAALRRLIAEARAHLAELESEFSRERYAVDAVQARLFELLRPVYQQRDELSLAIHFRRQYLDALMQEGDEEAAKTSEQYQQARRENQQEYEQAAEQSKRKSQVLSEDEQAAIKKLWSKLVRLYHPDRYQDDPEKQAVYQHLTAEINQARDQGDLDRLRKIAEDPNGFLLRQGMASLDFDDDDQVPRLRQLYEGLQAQILEAIETLGALRASPDYELYQSSTRDPDWLQGTAQTYSETLQAEIVRLKQEAAQLAEEIEGLTGVRAVG